MARHYTEELADFIAGVRYEQIPASAVERVKLLALDTAGCGLLGAGMPWTERLLATLRDVESPGNARVWGTALRFSPPSAALANGTAVHGFELDDVSNGSHHGSVVMTAGLAVADHRGPVSGQELMAGMVAGIEAAVRVFRCVGRYPHVTMGFHGPGLFGTFGAAASASRVLGLNGGQVADALGHAAQQTGGLMATQHGGMGKRLLAGKAAQDGTLSALLAAHGFTNVHNVFEAEYGGFCSAFSGAQPTYDLERLVSGLGSEWASDELNFKMWAARVPIHPPLEGLRELRQAYGITADQVKGVRVWLDEGAHKAVGFPWVPTTATSAQLNLRYCAAMLLLEGDVFAEQFREERLADPCVLGLTRRIDVIHDPAVDTLGSFHDENRVEVQLKDGRTLSAVGRLRGRRGQPITRQDVVEKFKKVTARQLTPERQEQLIALCDRLDCLDDVRELSAALAV